MVSPRIDFFATASDIEAVLSVIEVEESLKYSKTGLLDYSEIEEYTTWRSIPNLGFATHGDTNFCESYLVVWGGDHVHVREVPQRKGGVLFAVDQLANPISVVFSPGGVFKDSAIISGGVGTVGEHEESRRLYRLFKKIIVSKFTAIRSYRVGEGAKRYLDAGARLTPDIALPREYDLAP